MFLKLRGILLMADYDPNFNEKLFDVIKYRDAFSPITIIVELAVYALVGLLLYHGYKKYGSKKIILYFLGGFFLTVFEENFMILTGFFPESAFHSTKTYFYNLHGYLIWFAAVPLTVMLSWFILTYSSFQIAARIIPEKARASLIKRVLIAGWLGMSIDFVIDPIVIRNYGWIWLNNKEDAFWFLQVPVTNFLGFFLLVASFNMLFFWYWERFIPKHPRLAGSLGILLYFPLILLPLFFTILVIIILFISFIPLNGIDISWWNWPR